jgi:hypothetical protein
MRGVNPLERLSGGVAGTIGGLNSPGSPQGAVESLQAVMDTIERALELLAGQARE